MCILSYRGKNDAIKVSGKKLCSARIERDEEADDDDSVDALHRGAVTRTWSLTMIIQSFVLLR